MPVKAKAAKFTKDDKVMVDIDGTDTLCTVTKLKGDNYIVTDEEGTVYECEPHELTLATDEEEEEETPKKKSAKKPAAEEEEEEETPAPKKKKAAPESEEEEEEEKPAKKAVKGKKKGGLGWNDTAPAEAAKSFGLPPGQWEALAYNGVCEAGKGEGIQAYIEYVGVHDDEVTGKTQRGYYTIVDEKGNPSEGIGYFKRDLITLGFTEEQLEIDESDNETVIEELNKLLKKLRKMEPWVTISVKVNAKTGNSTLYLNGVMDDQEDKPANPLSE